jgi:hypothetical protein
VIPTLTGAGASSLAPERFATGAAVLTMGRQIGAALGVAVLVAVLGTATSTASDFHSAWLISVAGGLATGLALAAIGRPAQQAAAARIAAEPEQAHLPLVEEALADASLVTENAA